MKKMATNQKGLTFIGLVFILGFIAIVVLFALRAFPLYNEKFQVVTAMKSVVTRPDASTLSNSEVRKYFMRNIQVTNISRFNNKNIKNYMRILKPKKKGQPKVVHLKYDATNNLVADLKLTLAFDQKMPLSGPDDGE